MLEPLLDTLFVDEFDNMVSLARVLSHDADSVEDIVMDAFLETAERIDSISNPGGYLRVSVINGARRRYRKNETRSRIRDRFSTSLVPQDVTSTSEHYLEDVLTSLSEREHTAIVLVYYLNCTNNEAGRLMGCPTGTVKSLVHRALIRLRHEVAP